MSNRATLLPPVTLTLVPSPASSLLLRESPSQTTEKTKWIFVKVCGNCNAESPSFNCSRCKEISYCNETCQRSAWKAHKEFCLPHGISNPFGGSRADLKKLVVPPPHDDEAVCQFEDENGVISLLTQREFKEKTGKDYARYFSASVPSIIAWQKMAPAPISQCRGELKGLLMPTEEEIKAFHARGPSILRLKNVPSMGGFGVVAGEKIPARSVFYNYSGEIKYPLSPGKKDYATSMYAMDPVDASKKAGLIVFANDGPPNFVFASIPNCKGVPEAVVAFAIKDIQVGEALWTHYGDGHPLTSEVYRIAPEKFEELKRHCSTGKFYKKFSSAEDLHLFLYIYQTRSIFFRLHLEKALNTQQTRDLLPHRIPQERTQDWIALNLILRTTEHILSFNDSRLTKEVLKFSTLFRTPVFITLLSLLEKDRNLTVHEMEAYKRLGDILNKLYLFTHQKHYGSPITLKGDEIKQQLSTLPTSLQEAFPSLMSPFIIECIKENYVEERDRLYLLCNELFSEEGSRKNLIKETEKMFRLLLTLSSSQGVTMKAA